MADIDRLVKLIVDISSDDFFFTVNIDPVWKKVCVYVFIGGKVVDSSFHDLSDIEKAIEWIKGRHKKHTGGE